MPWVKQMYLLEPHFSCPPLIWLRPERCSREHGIYPTQGPELLPEQRLLSMRPEEIIVFFCYSTNCSVSLLGLHPRRGLVKTKGNCNRVPSLRLKLEFSFTRKQTHYECAGIHNSFKPTLQTGRWKMLHHGNTHRSAAATSTAHLTGQDGTLNACHLKQRQARYYTSSPFILFVTPVLRCILAMCGKARLPTLSLADVSMESWYADFSDLIDNYHIRLEATHEKKEPSSHQLFHHVWSKTGDPKKSSRLLQWIPQDTISWEGLGECPIFQVMPRYLRNTLIPVSNSLKYLKVHFQE